MKVFGRQIEPLLFWWKLGVVIAFLFLIGSISWLIFQGVLICQAYAEGDLAYIDWKFWRYASYCGCLFYPGGFPASGTVYLVPWFLIRDEIHKADR